VTSSVPGPALTSPPTGVAAPAIVATDLRKAFGKNVALDGVSLTVPRGSVFALLGPNGSGKTTPGAGVIHAPASDAGSAEVLGHDLRKAPAKVRAGIGVTGQFSAVDGMLTGEENLLLMAKLYHLARDDGRARARRLLERFDLDEAASRPPSTYSGGMRRRLDIAMTLMGDPALIFLDEPTTGLDPRSRQTMWQIVRVLVAEGVTVFLTTQFHDQFLHQLLGQHRSRSWGTLRGQSLLTARGPGPPPRIRRLGRDLQLGSDLRCAHPVREHPRRLQAYLLAPGASLRTDPTAVPVSHALSRHAERTARNHPNQRYGHKSDPDP
jgi:ABC-type Na+ transport system ATPase subunit NatA